MIDEASRVDDALYRSVRPMLAVSGGRLAALSTPFGKHGWWHEAWATGGTDWERVEVPWWMCPRITPGFIAEERRTIGDWWVDQEYCCKFMETSDQVFTHEDIQATLDPLVMPL